MVFARAPVAGATKTRLIPTLGAAGAAQLHARLVERAVATARAAAPHHLALWCAPGTGDPCLQRVAARYDAELHAQLGIDLGARMAHAFAITLTGSTAVVCIGADCPALRPQHLLDAVNALRLGSDAVFVPAEDGGYVLVGLARHDPRLFEDISWGGAMVMAQTRARLRDLQWRWTELAPLWDVDRPEDAMRLRHSGLLDADPTA